jgi:hypothetical protein
LYCKLIVTQGAALLFLNGGSKRVKPPHFLNIKLIFIMANLIDEIPMLNPFDLKTGIFKHTDTNVILIHKINSLNGTVVLSKGDVKEKENIVFLNEIWNYKFEHFLDVFATDLFFYYAYEDVSYLTEDQYNQLGYLEELRVEG